MSYEGTTRIYCDRGRAHSITYRRHRRAWNAIAELAERCADEPLDSRLRDAALAEIAKHFGTEISVIAGGSIADALSGCESLDDTSLADCLRVVVGEARQRVRRGQPDEELLQTLTALEQLPKIILTTEDQS